MKTASAPASSGFALSTMKASYALPTLALISVSLTLRCVVLVLRSNGTAGALACGNWRSLSGERPARHWHVLEYPAHRTPTKVGEPSCGVQGARPELALSRVGRTPHGLPGSLARNLPMSRRCGRERGIGGTRLAC